MNSKEYDKRETVSFKVAGHAFGVCVAEADKVLKWLPAFAPFRCEEISGSEAFLFYLNRVDQKIYLDECTLTLLSEISGLLGYCCKLSETITHYVVDIQFTSDGQWHRMVCDKTFKNPQVWLDSSDSNVGNVLNSFLMIAFAQSAVFKQTILIHASVVVKEGHGYAFLGASGTGKSTHSALWMRHLEGVELLNDDNPAIRVERNGKVIVYGTPWSGKTPCYKNKQVDLMAFVRLRQAPVNRFSRKCGTQALISLLPSCSSLRWNKELYSKLCDILEILVSRIQVCQLECLPNQDAALLCYEGIINSTRNSM